jgi:hypothetical protein
MMEIKITDYNGLTKESIVRLATDEEIAEYEARKAKFAEIKAEAELKAQAKAALLERLGITADEAKLLLA